MEGRKDFTKEKRRMGQKRYGLISRYSELSDLTTWLLRMLNAHRAMTT